MKRVIPHQRKPFYKTGIDWSNPITKGLEHLYIALPAGIFDLVSNKFISNPASTETSAVTKEGVMRDFDGSVLGYDVIEEKDRRVYSFGGIFVLDTLSASAAYAAIGWSTTGDPFGWIRTDTSGATVGLFHRSNNTAVQTTAYSTAEVVVGEPFKFTGSFDGLNLHVKLNNETPNTGSTTDDAFTINRVGFAGMRRTGDGQQLDSKVSLVWLYDKALSDKELAELHKNPYQLLQPRTQLIGVTAGVAPPSGAIINQLQCSNMGADLYNGTLL